jgi:hypothetical protein
MTFEQLLASYTGQMIETVVGTEFYTGRLLSVNNGLFTISTSDGYSTQQITLLVSRVVYVRILTAAA